MFNKRILLACLQAFLLVLTICSFFPMFHVAHAAVINVPQDYPTIQQAIDQASDGDTIHVECRSGESQSVYYERLVIDKELILEGESRENITIDGGGAGTVIRVQAHNVEIRGFTITNAGQKYSGIRANGYFYVTVANNTLKTNKKGIVLLNSNYNTVVHNLLFNNTAEGISLSESIGNNVSDNDISDSAYGIKCSYVNTTFVNDNTVTDSSYGIYLEYSSNDTVHGNILHRNGVDGIFPHACHDIIVSNNEVSESAYGIQLYSSKMITILGNNATGNSYGIYLAYSSPLNTIENNTISDNDWGVALYNSSGNTLKGNTLSYNTYGIDPVTDAHNNQVYHNNFIDNTEQVVWNPDCLNTWDDGYPSGGNYWSDYTGTDSNEDGIGDTAYSIDPNNKDRYPLMTPWGAQHDVAVISATLSDTEAYVGEIVIITVVAENQGSWTENFTITTRYENTTLGINGTIATQEIVDLAPGKNTTLTFSWNTTDMQPCVSYTVKAEAGTVLNEIDTEDNYCTDGKVKVKIVGDLNGDGIIDIEDLAGVGRAFGTKPGDPLWNPEADLNHDNLIDIDDLIIVARKYGETCP